MSSNWPLKKISEIANFLNNKRIPLKSLDRQKRQGSYPYYGASGIVDSIDGYIFDGTYLLISEDGENLRTRKTPIAFKAHGKFWVNNHAHILSEQEEGVLDYLEYYFSTLDLNPYITGAAQPKLNKANLDSINIPFPDRSVRLFINSTLNSLTQKIATNNQINQTLEQMAQALFKSWFVDFEPVKAKMSVLEAGGSQEDATLAAMAAISGKDADALAVFEHEYPEQYAELKATAELFPSAMQDSELGGIPQGWKLKSFGDVSKCYDKKRIPLSKPQREKKKGEIPYYGATSIMDYVDEYIFDGIYLLLGEDGSVIKENGLPFTQYIWGKSWVNNHAHVLTGSESVTTEHLMVFIKQENIAAYVTGAVQMKLNQKNMNSIPFIFADEAVNNVFGQRIDSIYAVIRAKSEENLTLTNLRDTLLPKLLSGEITLPEAEQAVSEAENV